MNNLYSYKGILSEEYLPWSYHNIYKRKYHRDKAYEGTCRIPGQNCDVRGNTSARFVWIVKAV